ncbi:MAG: AAA family ATPase [Myxococcaceae bacterium]|nr:AAA family ATPase [Myxococcaceae bacterium]
MTPPDSEPLVTPLSPTDVRTAPAIAAVAPAPAGPASLDDVRRLAQTLRERMRDQVMGRDDIIELVLVALFADGHVLLEDYPGSGKTTLAKSLGHSIVDDLHHDEIADFRRIQFTPDLLPSDVTGVMIFDTATNGFSFRRGPVFAYVVLVDEINRTSPKVQSALLEAMAEKQVTVDNTTHRLDDLFFVLATQNPLDSVGTYPLPMAQLDRFLFKLSMKHIDRASELEVLRTWGTPRTPRELPKVTRGHVVASRGLIRSQVAVDERVQECLVDIARLLRADKRVRQGVSTRCLVQAIPALQTLAVLRGRDYVSSADLESLAPVLFAHRLDCAPGVQVDALITETLRAPIERLSRQTIGGA